MISLTPHFSWRELTTTSTGLPNTPDLEVQYKLRALCAAVLEPWRERVGPLSISSAYRSPQVNDAVNGSSQSRHMTGEAADCRALNIERGVAWAVLLEMMTAGFPVDQAIIYENTRHIHVAHLHERVARRQILVRVGDRGGGAYVPWASYSGPLKT